MRAYYLSLRVPVSCETHVHEATLDERRILDIDTLVRDSNQLVELLLGGGGEQRAAHKLIKPIAT